MAHDAAVLECLPAEGEPGLPGPERIGQVVDVLLAASQESDQREAGLVTKCQEAGLRPPEVSRAGRDHGLNTSTTSLDQSSRQPGDSRAEPITRLTRSITSWRTGATCTRRSIAPMPGAEPAMRGSTASLAALP